MSEDLKAVFNYEHYELSVQSNGDQYWYASEFMTFLGYDNLKKFRKAIDRATKAMISLNIPHEENILYVNREGKKDYKLTRFACYMTAMNADPRKREVAEAQVYFAAMTRSFEKYQQCSDDIERVRIREELKEDNKLLSSTAKQHGVTDYARFANAGYLGMYNMYNWQLAKKRHIKSKELLNHMGRAELVANQFRTVMTEEKIKSDNVQGQANLEAVHKKVGKEVRDMVINNTGRPPEQLAVDEHIKEPKKRIKSDKRKLKQLE